MVVQQNELSVLGDVQVELPDVHRIPARRRLFYAELESVESVFGGDYAPRAVRRHHCGGFGYVRVDLPCEIILFHVAVRNAYDAAAHAEYQHEQPKHHAEQHFEFLFHLFTPASATRVRCRGTLRRTFLCGKFRIFFGCGNIVFAEASEMAETENYRFAREHH